MPLARPQQTSGRIEAAMKVITFKCPSILLIPSDYRHGTGFANHIVLLGILEKVLKLLRRQ